MKNEELPKKKTLGGWAESARLPFLNFARNLPSQILLASLAWLVGRKLDINHFDISNTLHTSIFVSFVILFLYAAYANASIFIEDLLPDFSGWMREQETLIRERMSEETAAQRLHIPVALAKITVKNKKTELLIGVIVVWVIEIALSGAVVASLISASNFVQTVRA